MRYVPHIDTIGTACYANDNTPYRAGKTQCNLEKTTKGISQTF